MLSNDDESNSSDLSMELNLEKEESDKVIRPSKKFFQKVGKYSIGFKKSKDTNRII